MVGTGHFEQGVLGWAAILGVIPGALDVIDRGADVHGRAVLRAGRAGEGCEIRQAVEREIHLERRAFDAVVLDGRAKFRVELAGLDEFEERGFRIEIGGHDAGVDFVAIFEHHAVGAAVAHQDAADRGVDADLRASGCGPRRRSLPKPRPFRPSRIPRVRVFRRLRPCSDASGCKRCRRNAGRRWRRSRRRWRELL